MTASTKNDKAEPDQAEPSVPEASATETAAGDVPLCGKPHFLPMLAGHVTCQLEAPDPDRAPGTPEHEHQHQDGDALYVWQ